MTDPGLAVFCFLVLAAAWSGAAEPAQTNLAGRLSQLDASVLRPEERKAARQMLAEDVRRRLREANERSSAEWRAITDRGQWERFRAAKLEALRASLGRPA